MNYIHPSIEGESKGDIPGEVSGLDTPPEFKWGQATPDKMLLVEPFINVPESDSGLGNKDAMARKMYYRDTIATILDWNEDIALLQATLGGRERAVIESTIKVVAEALRRGAISHDAPWLDDLQRKIYLIRKELKYEEEPLAEAA